MGKIFELNATAMGMEKLIRMVKNVSLLISNKNEIDSNQVLEACVNNMNFLLSLHDFTFNGH